MADFIVTECTMAIRKEQAVSVGFFLVKSRGGGLLAPHTVTYVELGLGGHLMAG